MKFAVAIAFALLCSAVQSKVGDWGTDGFTSVHMKVCVVARDCNRCKENECCVKGVPKTRCHPISVSGAPCSLPDDNGLYHKHCGCAEGLTCELGDGNKLRCKNAETSETTTEA